MRALIYQACKDIPAIAEDCSGRMYQAGALGIGDAPANPDRPYALITELPSVPFQEVRKTAHPANRFFQFWVYDDRGDFARIDNILLAVRETILGLESQVDASTGARCIGVLWTGDSQDIPQDQQDTNAKYSLFQLTSTK